MTSTRLFGISDINCYISKIYRGYVHINPSIHSYKLNTLKSVLLLSIMSMASFGKICDQCNTLIDGNMKVHQRQVHQKFELLVFGDTTSITINRDPESGIFRYTCNNFNHHNPSTIQKHTTKYLQPGQQLLEPEVELVLGLYLLWQLTQSRYSSRFGL